jgi:hypothetical protein
MQERIQFITGKLQNLDRLAQLWGDNQPKPLYLPLCEFCL